jgi:hypothetical protein
LGTRPRPPPDYFTASHSLTDANLCSGLWPENDGNDSNDDEDDSDADRFLNSTAEARRRWELAEDKAVAGLTPDQRAALQLARMPVLQQDPRQFLGFVQDYGVYYVKSIAIGGTLEFNLRLGDTASQSSQQIAASVEASFGSIFSTKVDYQQSYSNVVKQHKTMASLVANGGDPRVAALITDLGANGLFQDVLAGWIASIPDHPRVVDTVPVLGQIAPLIANQQVRGMLEDVIADYEANPLSNPDK